MVSLTLGPDSPKLASLFNAIGTPPKNTLIPRKSVCMCVGAVGGGTVEVKVEVGRGLRYWPPLAQRPTRLYLTLNGVYPA